eukprot:3555052-Pleurochrysis_carterae.AAC.1
MVRDARSAVPEVQCVLTVAAHIAGRGTLPLTKSHTRHRIGSHTFRKIVFARHAACVICSSLFGGGTCAERAEPASLGCNSA